MEYTDTMLILDAIIKMVVICYAISPLAAFISELLFPLVIKNRILSIINLLTAFIFSCSKCFTFWFTLIYTQNLFISAVTSLIVSIIEMLINKIGIKTEL